MKKMAALLMSIVMCVGLTGCSKASADETVTCQFTGTSFTVEGEDLGLYEYGGYYAKMNKNNVEFDVKFEQVDDLSYAEWNYDQIIVDNMTLYKNKAYSWSMYLGTQNVLYYPYCGNQDTGLYWIAVKSTGDISIEQATLYEWQLAEKLPMTNGQVVVECGDDVTFSSEFEPVKVTNDYASISGMCSIKKTTKPECTEPYTVVQNEKETYTLYKYDSDAYSYYQYGDWLIQTVLGLDLTQYFTFHTPT